MKGIFVDTAGRMDCADASDPAHRASFESRDAALEQGNIMVTTDRHFRQLGFQVLPH